MTTTEAPAFDPQSWLMTTRGGEPSTADTAELSRARHQFRRLFDCQITDATWADWQALGFNFALHDHQGVGYAVVSEVPSQKTGRGAYLFRLDAPPTTVLQAPHSSSDLHSGDLALELILNAPFKAAAWNTVDRRYNDLARAKASYFTALADAASEIATPARIFQLHGYDTDKRRTRSARESSLILSAGHRQPGVNHRQIVNCLQEKLPGKVSLFPHQTGELGGTRNPVAAVLLARGQDSFFHLEMALPLRQNLLTDANLRGALSSCMLDLP